MLLKQGPVYPKDCFICIGRVQLQGMIHPLVDSAIWVITCALVLRLMHLLEPGRFLVLPVLIKFCIASVSILGSRWPWRI